MTPETSLSAESIWGKMKSTWFSFFRCFNCLSEWKLQLAACDYQCHVEVVREWLKLRPTAGIFLYLDLDLRSTLHISFVYLNCTCIHFMCSFIYSVSFCIKTIWQELEDINDCMQLYRFVKGLYWHLLLLRDCVSYITLQLMFLNWSAFAQSSFTRLLTPRGLVPQK